MKKATFIIIFSGILTLTGCNNSISDQENNSSSILEQKVNQLEDDNDNLQNQIDQLMQKDKQINDIERQLAEEKKKNEQLENLIKNKEQKNQENESSLSGSNIKQIDHLWNQYENYDLGFKIKYPKKNVDNNVEIIEDNNVIYISDGTYSEKIIKKQNSSIFEKASGIPFAILIQNVTNDNELEKFIQKRYGNNCLLGEKKKSKTNSLFNITIDTSNWNPEDPEGCFVNYITIIKYDPIKGKVASWDIGQDINFMLNNKGIDQEISDSFEFF